MSDPVNFYPTSFCKITLNNIHLNHLQVGNIGYQYDIRNKPVQDDILLFLNVDEEVDIKRVSTLYKGSETDYLTDNQQIYYRNCNTIVSTQGKELFYKGRLFHSYLHLTWKENAGKIYIQIHVTKQYLFESRSRLTKNSAFDTLLNYLIMHFATELGFIAFHGAAVNSESDESIVFMGLPNTGKTTTSVSFATKNKTQLVAEDIIFINKDTMKVYSCPFTLNPKSTERFKADSYIGDKVGSIVILTRSEVESYVRGIGHSELSKNVLNMNFFEFSWLHDGLIRHLFFTGGASLREVSEKYAVGQKSICSKVNGIELGGKDPVKWVNLLEDYRYQSIK
ncbi:hypothetical protein N9W97_02960 [Pseudomonadales bacterium]|nr:hypothetical protein [Pseudomonadales bacterium]